VLATFVEHVAMQIARHVRSGQVLVTGGAAFDNIGGCLYKGSRRQA